MRKEKMDLKLIGEIVLTVVMVVLAILNSFRATDTQKRPVTPEGGVTSNTAISISTDTEIEVEIYHKTVFAVDKAAYYSWDDTQEINLCKNRFRVYDTLEVPDGLGLHKLTIVYGQNVYVYYYNVEES